jgi:archaellum component FlaG (FlaF/FlaG flagellin family)
MNKHEFAICVDNHGYEVSLEMRKLYEVIVDADAEKHNQIRVIDESGEDYLYPATLFDRITLPPHVMERVFHAQT